MNAKLHPLEIALALSKDGKPDEAETILRQMPDDLRARFNLGWHDLRHGDFRKGFEGLDAGRWIGVFGSPPIPGPIWRNQPLNGKTLLFRGEGGLGDQICNFRFALMFKRMGANIVVSCSAALAPLLSRHGVVCIVDQAIPHTHYDFWVPAMSAAYVLGFDYDSLPGNPFLRAPKQPRGSKFRIGLRWGGNAEQKDIEPSRKIPVEGLLESVKGDYELFSFQRDADLIDFPGTDLRDELKTWEDTAKWLSSMDLLITSCTSVAHLGAALGVPTWILTPIMPYYTWAVPGNQTAWYDTATLFRQTEIGNWNKPLEQVSRTLREAP